MSVAELAKQIKNLTALLTAVSSLVSAGTALAHGLDWRWLAASAALLGLTILLARNVIARRLWPSSELLDKAALNLSRTTFVGRQDECERLLQLISNSRLVFFVGESGSGKSSLLTNGVLPELAASKNRFPLLIDNWQTDWVDGPRETLSDALQASLDDRMREALGAGRVVTPAVALELLGRIRDADGRTPVLLFDQFDDYLSLHRSKFLPESTGRLLTKDELLEVNGFWREIDSLNSADKVRCLFSSRNDSSWALTAVQFREPSTYYLPRLDRSAAETLLAKLTVDEKVVARPDRGFRDLRQRLLDDLSGSEGRLLPIEMRLAFKGLADLRYLTLRDYRRAGYLRGLESLHVSVEIDTAAGSAGVTREEVRSLLGRMISARSPYKTVACTFDQLLVCLTPELRHDRSRLQTVLDSLSSSQVIRPLLLRSSAERAWQLDHDFLCNVVLALEERANRSAHVLASAAGSNAEASSLLARWRSLLGPGTQVSLAMNRLRGRFTYGIYRRFALRSTLRFVPWIVVVAAVFLAIQFVNSLKLSDWSRGLAGAAQKADDLDSALLLAVAAEEAWPTPDAQDALLAALQRAPQIRTILHGHRGKALAFAPQLPILASADEDGAIQFWDTKSWSVKGDPVSPGHGAITSLAFSGDVLVSGDASGSVRLWDVRRQVEVGNLPMRGRGAVITVAMHPSGRYAMAGYRHDKALLWDLGQKPPRAIPLPTPATSGIFDPAGRRLALIDTSEALVVWDFAPAMLSNPWNPPFGDHATALAWSLRAGLVMGRSDGTILWLDDAARTVRLTKDHAHDDQVSSLAFNDDGSRLASGSTDGEIRVWSILGKEPLAKFSESPSVSDLAFAPGTLLLASGSADPRILLWDTALVDPLARAVLPRGQPTPAVAFGPDGYSLFAATDDGAVEWIDLTGRRRPRSLRIAEQASINRLAAAADRLLWSDDQHHFGLLDLASGQGQTLLQTDDSITRLALRDPEVFATGTADGHVTLWRRGKTWKPVELPPSREPLGSIQALAFDRGGQNLLAGDDAGNLLAWDVDSQQLRRQWRLPQGVTDLAFSPDSNQIAASTVSGDKGIIYFLRPNRDKQDPVTDFGCLQSVDHLAFSPDGRNLWAECNGSLQLLKLDGGSWRSAGTIELASQSVDSFVASPKGHVIATVADDDDGQSQLLVWDLDEASWKRRACRTANREMPASLLGWTGLPAGRCKSLLKGSPTRAAAFPERQ